jgi:hypothetical protein
MPERTTHEAMLVNKLPEAASYILTVFSWVMFKLDAPEPKHTESNAVLNTVSSIKMRARSQMLTKMYPLAAFHNAVGINNHLQYVESKTMRSIGSDRNN